LALGIEFHPAMNRIGQGVIVLRGVSKRYGAHEALHPLDLEIPAGQIFAFLGPNGAGKTTTIKLMVGLLRPSAGQIELGGIDVVRQTEQANQLIGYVPDEPYLYDKLTAREFLEFVARLHGLDPLAAAAGVTQQIEQFELAPFVDQLCETYSHGMKQRTVFAAALVHDPPILIVDEPMVGLDPRSVRLVKDLMRRRAAAGTTVFMSTHTLSVAEELADVVGIIDQGRLRFLGPVASLHRQLQQQFGDRRVTLEDLFLALTGTQADT
jgi:ABC-2 type transport system ATP-binding protein